MFCIVSTQDLHHELSLSELFIYQFLVYILVQAFSALQAR